MRKQTAGWIVVAWLASGLSTPALIKVEFPVSRIYGDSETVALGAVVSLNPENRVAELKFAAALKGGPFPETVKVQIAEPPELAASVAAGQPAVLFVRATSGDPLGIVHVADSWLMAQAMPGRGLAAWRVTGPYDGARSFPGRTVALARVVEDLKAGRAGVQDVLDPLCYAKPPRQVGRVDGTPLCLAAADVNGDRLADAIVGTDRGFRLLLAGTESWSNATESAGLAAAPASRRAAAGDTNGDGKPDLLLGDGLWLNEGGRFTRSDAKLALPPEADCLSVALLDATGDGKPDALALTAAGELTVLENPGAAGTGEWKRASRPLWRDRPALAAELANDWGDNGEPFAMVAHADGPVRYAVTPAGGSPADVRRLTGALPTPTAAGEGAGAFRLAFGVDCDGNGKRDFVTVTERGGVALLNRGLGVFLADDTIPRKFRPAAENPLPFPITTRTRVAPGDARGLKPRQNLLVLAEDRRLFELVNAAN
jgi:hypothetical protein